MSFLADLRLEPTLGYAARASVAETLGGPVTPGRRISLLLTCAALLAACARTPTKGPGAEDFDSFLARFISDEAVRDERVVVPLTAVIAGCGNERLERWGLEEIQRHAFWPRDRASLDAQGLTQRVERISPTVAELLQYQEQSDSYVAVFRFSLREDRWFLEKVSDESCAE